MPFGQGYRMHRDIQAFLDRNPTPDHSKIAFRELTGVNSRALPTTGTSRNYRLARTVPHA